VTFIKEGNRKYLDDGSINMELVNLFTDRWEEIAKFQNTPYVLPPSDPVLKEYLEHPPLIDDPVRFSSSIAVKILS